MKKLLIAFIMLLSINAFGDDINLWKKSTLNQILERGELSIGFDPGYMPFEMRTKRGDIIGFDIDIAREMANAMGVKLKLVPNDWNGIIASLLTGKFDMILAGMTVTSERNLRINFTDPYITIGQTLLANKKHAGKTWKDLDKSGYTITAKLGTTGEIVAKKIFKNAKIKTFEAQSEAIQEVMNGVADAWIYDQPPNSIYMLEKGKGTLVHMNELLTSEPLAIGIRKGDPDFLNWLNNFLSQIKHDGTYDRIYNKWFNDDKWLNQVQ
ncbi:MAG: transporter substrate-binding domain-containing protein [Campylobacteraceae bacterium]